jgi:hypothetical protein
MSMNRSIRFLATLSCMTLVGAPLTLAESAPTPIELKVPPGFTIELVAGPPLTERPIVGSFDEKGLVR